MYKTIALIVAAGCAKRFGGTVNKLLQLINGKSVLGHVLEKFTQHPLIDKVCVVVSENILQNYQEALGGFIPIDVICGGASRKDSVRNGLNFVAKYRPQNILIHDAARPFVSGKLISNVVKALEDNEVVDVLMPVVDTLKKFDDEKLVTVSREDLYQTQTPQGFKFQKIYQLHQNNSSSVTDDISLFLEKGLKISYVRGEASNYKITFREDI